MKFVFSLIFLFTTGCASLGNHESSAGQLVLGSHMGRYQVWWTNPDKDQSSFKSDVNSCALEHVVDDIEISQVAKGSILGHCLSMKGWTPMVIEEIVVL
jgi:hypothetical protein